MSNLEFIVQNKKDILQAQKNGASRLELVSAISEGGLTPSYGTLKQTINISSIPLNVVVRPHSYHYFYDEEDMKVILEDVKKILSLGGRNIVFGSLNRDGTINEKALQDIIKINPDIEITFHGAIDYSNSIIEAYKTLLKYKDNVKTIVTAGAGKDVIEGANNLSEMVKIQKKEDGPVVMPGTGLRLSNIQEMHKIIKADQYHFGQGVRIEENYNKGFNQRVIKDIKEILSNK